MRSSSWMRRGLDAPYNGVMAKTYDALLKTFVDAAEQDWPTFHGPRVGLPAGTAMEPLDSDLATVTSVQADKLFRVLGQPGGLLHLELEGSHWAGLAERLLLYSVLARSRWGGPVRSVAVLLRRAADSPQLTGTLTYTDERGDYLTFRYTVIRVWQLSAGELARGPLGVTPLALLTDDAEPRLEEVFRAVAARADAALPPAEARDFKTECGILLGLRYNEPGDDRVRRLLAGVLGMEESSYYQHILEKGRQDMLVRLAAKKFGPLPAEAVQRLGGLNDVAEADRLAGRLLEAGTWQDWLGVAP